MAKTKKQRAPKSSSPVLSPVQIGLVVVAALLIVGGLVLLGSQLGTGKWSSLDVTPYPAVGDKSAPLTMIEFSDYG